MGLTRVTIDGILTEVEVYGRASSDHAEQLEEIKKALSDAGFIVSHEGDLSIVITKRLEDFINEQQNPTA